MYEFFNTNISVFRTLERLLGPIIHPLFKNRHFETFFEMLQEDNEPGLEILRELDVLSVSFANEPYLTVPTDATHIGWEVTAKQLFSNPDNWEVISKMSPQLLLLINNVTDSDYVPLATFLENNYPALRCLRIHCSKEDLSNFVDEAKFLAFTNVLPKLDYLEYIEFKCLLSEGSLISLMEGVRLNRSLGVLNLGWVCDISDSTQKTLRELLHENTVLTTIEDCSFFEEFNKLESHGERILGKKYLFLLQNLVLESYILF
jgi:hypothetical protein